MIHELSSLEKEIKNTQIIIPAGGSGKRMGKIGIPKALLQLTKNKTLLDNEIEFFARWGFKNFKLLLGVGSDKIISHLESKKDYYEDELGLKFDFSVDPTNVNWGKGKAMKYAIINGVIEKDKRGIITFPDDLKLDPYLPIKLLLQHLYGVERIGTLSTVVLISGIEFPFGVAKVNEDGIIKEFVEKPLMNTLTSIGLYAIEPEVYKIIEDLIDLEAPHSIEFESVVLSKLASEGKIFSLTIPSGNWIAVNDIKAYEKAIKIYEEFLSRVQIKEVKI